MSERAAAPADPAELARLRAAHPALFTRPLSERLVTYAVLLALGALLLHALAETGFFDFQAIWLGLHKLGGVLAFMLPPAHNGWFMEFLDGIFETLAMAFLGTLAAAVLALPLALLASRNIVANALVHFSTRRLFDGLRGIDQLIWALVFINVVGLGPFAGILAIAVSDCGTLGKLFSEAFENADERPVDGVRAAGAGQLLLVRFGLLPQVLPVIISQCLYYFESNTRSATILGIVGAGGIGLQLSDRIRVNNWDEACFIILMILVTVALIDSLSRWLRERLIGRLAYRP